MSVVNYNSGPINTSEETGRSTIISIPSGQTGLRQGITIAESRGDEYPTLKTVTVGGTTATAAATYTFYAGGYYHRITVYHCAYSTPGSATVFVSGLGLSGTYTAYAYSLYNVIGVSSTSVSSTGFYTPINFTANGPGSFTIFATAQDEPEANLYAYSGSTLDDTYAIGSVSAAVGYESNSAATTASGTGFPYSSYAGVGILFNVANSSVELDADGDIATATPGSALVGSRIFVDTELTTGNNDGSSWENAYRTLTAGFAAVTNGAGDSVYVKAGYCSDVSDYIETAGNTAYYAGFNRALTGTNAPINDRNPFLDRTIVKPTYSATEFGCIRAGKDGSSNVRIDGFMFLDCSTEDAVTAYSGGAIIIEGASDIIIANCIFQNCDAGSGGYGGALGFATITDLVITNCRFNLCSSNGYGGSISVSGCSGIIENCDINSSIAFYGGAISVITTPGTGDGINIIGCVTGSCEATTNGSSVYVETIYDDCLIYQCSFRSSVGTLPAIYYTGDSSYDLVISNCTIVDNSGSGISDNGSSTGFNIIVTNCTIANNAYYGINHNNGGSRYLYCHNSILWGNSTGQINGTLDALTYTDVEGSGYDGSSGDNYNIDVDPQFEAVGSAPYRLNRLTDCVDGGNASVSGYLADDITGFTRTGTPDMGAYEYRGAVTPPGAIDTSLYRLQMHGWKNNASRSANFVFPYLLQEAPAELVDFNFGTFIDDLLEKTDCYPLQFGSEVEIDGANAVLNEVWRQQYGRQVVERECTDQQTNPDWEFDFDSGTQSSDETYIGTTGQVARGEIVKGIFNNELHRPMFEAIRYSCSHKSSFIDPLYVYNIWAEGRPMTARDTEPCAKWIATSTDVSEEDFPVSSGLMIELVRILNILAWEARGPMSVPIFGRYVNGQQDIIVI